MQINLKKSFWIVEYQRGIQDRNTKDSIEESIAFINENFDKDIDVLKIK